MAPRRTLAFFLMSMIVGLSVAGHKHKRRLEKKVDSGDSRRAVRDDGHIVCPPPLGVITSLGRSENMAETSNQGGMSNLMYVCGTVHVPYQTPSSWAIAEGPNGSMFNVTIYEETYKMVPLCCPGYVRNDKDVCVPKCKGNCKNGLCVSPNNCTCYDGYALNDLGDCVVTCPCACEHGQCYGDTCVCKSGYNLDSNGVCNPVCKTECVNGDCTSPNGCTCHFGYEKKKNQDSHVCSPSCTPPCENGTCVQTNVCECNDGYTLQKNTGRCVPNCNNCKNGNCVAPNTCKCHIGYKWKKETCAPVCSSGCFNAVCIAPDVCKCDDGFKYGTLNICIPGCSPSCENAVCVAPNTCQCNPGFMKKSLIEHYMCVSTDNATTHR